MDVDAQVKSASAIKAPASQNFVAFVFNRLFVFALATLVLYLPTATTISHSKL